MYHCTHTQHPHNTTHKKYGRGKIFTPWVSSMTLSDTVCTRDAAMVTMHGTSTRLWMQRRSKTICKPAKNCLACDLWIVLFMLSFSISPNCCQGVCAKRYFQYEYRPEFVSHFTGSGFCWNLHQRLEFGIYLSRPPTPQHLRHDPKYNSKVPWTHASNCRQKANVLRVRTDQSGLGTYHVSLT